MIVSIITLVTITLSILYFNYTDDVTEPEKPTYLPNSPITSIATISPTPTPTQKQTTDTPTTDKLTTTLPPSSTTSENVTSAVNINSEPSIKVIEPHNNYIHPTPGSPGYTNKIKTKVEITTPNTLNYAQIILTKLDDETKFYSEKTSVFRQDISEEKLYKEISIDYGTPGTYELMATLSSEIMNNAIIAESEPITIIIE